MFVAVICADIKIGEKSSLKEKRKILRSVIDRLKNKFNVSVAEVGHQDKWQRSVIGFAILSNDNAHVNSSADKVINFLHDVPDIDVIKIDLEIIGF